VIADIRLAADADLPRVAALRRTWSEEWAGTPSERSAPFYQRAGFGPATMLLAQVLEG
jgi:hypothetical protein